MSFYSAVVIFLLVMDPFGNIPAFLSMLSKLSPGRRRFIILREMVIALVILLIFLFFGRYILTGLHLSQTALTISGGILLFIIAIKMIFPESKKVTSEEQIEEEPMVVPLAVPLIAGPSAMAMVILFSTQYPSLLLHWFFALIVAWTITGIILLSSDYLTKWLGIRSLKAIERLTGMILTVMAIQMLLTGIQEFIHSL